MTSLASLPLLLALQLPLPETAEYVNPVFLRRADAFQASTPAEQREQQARAQRDALEVRRVDPLLRDLPEALTALDAELVATRRSLQELTVSGQPADSSALRARLDTLEHARVEQLRPRPYTPDPPAPVPDLCVARGPLPATDEDPADGPLGVRVADLKRRSAGMRDWSQQDQRRVIDSQVDTLHVRQQRRLAGETASPLAELSPALQQLEDRIERKEDALQATRTWADLEQREALKREVSFLRTLRPVAEAEISAQLLQCLSWKDNPVPGKTPPAWCTPALQRAAAQYRTQQLVRDQGPTD